MNTLQALEAQKSQDAQKTIDRPVNIYTRQNTLLWNRLQAL
jgi:hypothetical protein